jgi:hypothetical protein
MTLTQTAEKPITVTTDEMISSFAEIRHGRRAVVSRHQTASFAPDPDGCARNLA